MLKPFSRLSLHLDLARRFTAASFVIFLLGTLAVGWWIGHQIELRILAEAGKAASLHVESFIEPKVQALAEGQPIAPEQAAGLKQLVAAETMGHKIVALNVWDAQGRLMYRDPAGLDTDPAPIHTNLERALRGSIVTAFTDLPSDEVRYQALSSAHLLEAYIPVHQRGTERIIGVAEYYENVGELESEIADAQRQSWLVIGAVMLAIYLLLVGFVRRANNALLLNEAKLLDQAANSATLARFNRALRDQVEHAAASAVALNERYLRRLGSELHDGPAQNVSVSLLQLDQVGDNVASTDLPGPLRDQVQQHLAIVQRSLTDALQEMRDLAMGLTLPQLENLSLAETIVAVSTAHERRTATTVKLILGDLPEVTSESVKITAYRLIQEALNNAYRHAAGAGQCVQVDGRDDYLSIVVSDRGPGIIGPVPIGHAGHLGLIGMRERVELLSGSFDIESEVGRGTRIVARLPLTLARSP